MLPIGPPPAQVSQALERGERLLWFGAPRTGVRLRGADLFMIPFSLLWGGFAIFWESMVFQAPNSPFFMKLWGIPFVLMGLYLIIGRFFFDAKMRANTLYALTAERVLIFSGVFQQQTKSLSVRNIPEISLVQANDGSGTISFGSLPPFSSFSGGMAGWPGRGRGLPPQFEMIEDAAAVAALVRDAQRKAST